MTYYLYLFCFNQDRSEKKAESSLLLGSFSNEPWVKWPEIQIKPVPSEGIRSQYPIQSVSGIYSTRTWICIKHLFHLTQCLSIYIEIFIYFMFL